MTLKEYINEFSYVDDMNEALYHCEKSTTVSYYDFISEMERAEKKYIFENADISALSENAKEGFFAKIGKTVMALIEKVSNFFKTILEKIGQITGFIDTDKQKVEKMISEHPELKDKIIMSLENGSMTISDIAKFEKDYLGLVELYKKSSIDENSFQAKVDKLIDEFNTKGQKVILTVGTVTGILLLVPKMVEACSKAKKSFSDINKALKAFQQDVEKNKINDPSKVRAILNAFTKAIGLETKEYHNRLNIYQRLANALRKFHMNKFADNLESKSDDKIAKDKEKLKNRRKAYDNKTKYLVNDRTKKDVGNARTLYEVDKKNESKNKDKDKKNKNGGGNP